MLKKLLLSTSLLFTSHVAFSQGVAINEDNSAANTSAILDIKSTTKGMLAPRMSAAQKTAITSPATGLLIYQTDGTAGFYYYNGTAWTFINAAGQNGLNSLSRTTVEAIGANCPTGGIKVEYGLDINSNGTLDTGEENATLTKFVCNGATGATGQGVPAGGTAGQVLSKINSTNYNTQWVTPSSGGSSGLTVKDANNAVLGQLISFDNNDKPTEITLINSTGYIYNIMLDGTFAGEQLYYATGTCSGARWLNSGSTTGVRQVYSNKIVYDGATSSFYSLASPDADGLTPSVFFTAGAIWAITAQNCDNSNTGTKGGFLLTPITRAAAGIPTTIVGPLTIE